MSSPLTARLKSLAFDARLSPALIRWLNRLDIDLQYTALDAGNPNAQLLKTLNKEELSRLYRAIKRHMEVWAGARVSSKNATRDRWQRSVGTQIMKLEWPEGSVQLSLTTDSMSFRTHAMNSDLSVHVDYGVRPIALILVELEGYVRLIRRAMVVRGQLERGAERTTDRISVAGPLADAHAPQVPARLSPTPHVRGYPLRGSIMTECSVGSAPRPWGTRPVRVQRVKAERLSPTLVGNPSNTTESGEL